MRTSRVLGVIIIGMLGHFGSATAEAPELTAVEYETVSQACRVGLPLIPVESDYGYETGEYALPLSESNGEVHSALIVNEAELRDIPECKAEIDNQIAERKAAGEAVS